jgi:hypothetical protein
VRRFPVGLAIALFSAVMLAIGWRIYGFGEFARIGRVANVVSAPSELYARLLIRYDKPPIFEEEYRMQDVNGISTFDYRIRGYNGRQITITQPKAAIYDVSYFFGSLDQNGIWQLMDKAPRPDTDAHYTLFVKQVADFKQGERTVTFTNPGYWATATGRRYEIDLTKDKPSDLLHLQSTQLADPHYEALVRSFREFGPPQFRQNIRAAQAQVVAGR